MAFINGIIPKQGFEVCRDLIGAILLVELVNQKTLQGNTLFPEIIEGNILLESVIPEDSAFQVRINILTDSATYGNMTQKDAQGRTLYFIDVFTSGTSSADSCMRRDKFVGMIGYIFRSAQYRTLGLPPGLIGGTYVEQFATRDPSAKEDTNFTSFARIQLAVRIQEEADQWSEIALTLNNTSVSLEMTNKGYKFVFNN